MPYVVAVVPARKGSKGIPRKNMQDLAGRPLVAHALAAALAARRINRVVLSTDGSDIAAVGHQMGAEVVDRPAALAADDTPTLHVLRHLLGVLDSDTDPIDGVVLLEPTSPFRTSTIVDACVDKLFSTDAQTVVTVTTVERNPHNIFAVEGDQARLYVEAPKIHYTRRQQFSHLKRLNGCVYAVRAESIRQGRLLSEPIRVVEMPAEAAVNIDSIVDLELARLLATQFPKLVTSINE